MLVSCGAHAQRLAREFHPKAVAHVEYRVNIDFEQELLTTQAKVTWKAGSGYFDRMRYRGFRIDSLVRNPSLVPNLNIQRDSTSLTLEDRFHPTQGFYFVDRDGDGSADQVWTQGQGKDTSSYLPVSDHVADKVTGSIELTSTEKKRLYATGDYHKASKAYTWHLPMSSYLIAIAGGDFTWEMSYSLSTQRTQLLNLPYKGMQDWSTATFKNTNQLMTALEADIGVPYPWGIYRNIPASNFLYGGMENTTMTIFNDEYLEHPDDAAYNSYDLVNAHEMAHHWFGNLVTAAHTDHHWLQEGFATYYSLKALEKVHGRSALVWELMKYIQELDQQQTSAMGGAVVSTGRTSATYYKHGAWALYALEMELGESRFRESVMTYLTAHRYATATTADFLQAIETATGSNMENWAKQWLYNDRFPVHTASQLLRENEAELSEVIARTAAPMSVNDYLDYFTIRPERHLAPVMIFLQAYNWVQHPEITIQDKTAVETAMADYLINGPPMFVAELITIPVNGPMPDAIRRVLTNHKSDYLRTRAVQSGWITVQDLVLSNRKMRSKYALEGLRGNYGNYWKDAPSAHALPLAQEQITTQYSTRQREVAFDYLEYSNAWDKTSLTLLAEATNHHYWRFHKSQRARMQRVLDNELHRETIEGLLPQLSQRARERIMNFIAERN